jgi:hypothetical protein
MTTMENRKHRPRKKIARNIYIIAVLCIFAATSTFMSNSDPRKYLPRLMSLATEDKPVIYTFFDDLNNVYGEFRGGKVTEDFDREIIEAWKDAWSSMGYIPKVLTMEDVKSHPDYEYFSESLDSSVPLGSNAAYDKACHLRWLAMSAVGGGIMADFDTVPVTPPQPEDFEAPEKFTLYQDFVPSLLKGTEEQWNNIAMEILDYALDPSNEQSELYSDMFGLRQLFKNPEKEHLLSVETPSRVADGLRLVLESGQMFDEKYCNELNNIKAIHVFHTLEDDIKSDFMDEMLQDGKYTSKRANLMAKWTDYWPTYFKNHCESMEDAVSASLSQENAVNHDDSHTNDNHEEPVIFSFFENLSDEFIDFENTEEIASYNKETIEAWQQAWSSMGYTTRILTTEDSKNHPDFESFSETLASSVSLGSNTVYGKASYLRWLAMAAVGGGMLSDFDTIPIIGPTSDFMEPPEKLTLYQTYVPSLMKGTAEQWTMAAQLILEEATKSKNQELDQYTDKEALRDLLLDEDKQDMFHIYKPSLVGDGHFLLKGASIVFSERHCEKLDNIIALHFNNGCENIENKDVDFLLQDAPYKSHRASFMVIMTTYFPTFYLEHCVDANMSRFDTDNNAVAEIEQDVSGDIDGTIESDVEELQGPVIHTFFDDLKNVYGDEDRGKRTTGDDMEILYAWKEAWSSMGYVPKVITMEDAKRHPDYENYSNILDTSVPMGTNTAYDKACYLRWLAMAAVGGGMMSDFDTVPLTRPQPQDFQIPQKFTFYEEFIPSLLQGTAEQWTLIAQEILEEALKPERKELGLYSDMLALKDLLERDEKRDMFHVYGPSLVGTGYGQLTAYGDSFTEVECFVLSDVRAVHFLHACEEVENELVDELIKDSNYRSHRATFMSKWPTFWPTYYSEHCEKYNTMVVAETEPEPEPAKLMDKQKPLIYTFFDDLKNVYGDDNRGKRTSEFDKEIIKAWEKAWSLMGYTPVVLTMKDARSHPDYKTYSKTLDSSVPLGSNTAYDKACYLRYLAMAAIGGGMLSDFDTVPIAHATVDNMKKPEKFTVYEHYVPSLMKGTADQWTMVAQAILEEAVRPRHQDKNIYSDMMALDDVLKSDKREMFEVYQPYLVADGRRVLQSTSTSFTNEDCNNLLSIKAVHFYHSCEDVESEMSDELLENSEFKSHRATFMSKIPNYWPTFLKERCPEFDITQSQTITYTQSS